MSSSESSLSPSPPTSPSAAEATNSLLQRGPPNLERLVDHYVAAKRSLTCTSHVYRSHDIVTGSRALIEETAVLNAKNAFARRGLDEQVDTLDAIRDALFHDADKVSDEFAATLAELDKAHSRLEKTLKTLRKTVVGTGNAPRGRQDEKTSEAYPAEGSREDDPEQDRTLYEFIDEDSHEQLLSSLRGLIDSYHLARSDLDNNFSSFDSSLRSVAERLADNGTDWPPDKPTLYDQDEPPTSVAQLFRSMEEHATEMASLLENLVKHYDLCVSALRHTEGGGEAARIAVQAHEQSKGNHNYAGLDESLYGRTAADPMSDEERNEILQILENDAQEVEDVVTEIQGRGADMEDAYAQLSKFTHRARARNDTLRDVLQSMHGTRSAMPIYLSSAQKFRESWLGINDSIQSKTKELSELSVFYEQFLSGYGQLLREVERRKASEAQMKKMAEKARREMERLYEADRKAREEFMEDVGHYLPRDLGAFHGLEEEGVRFEVRAVMPDDEDEEDEH